MLRSSTPLTKNIVLEEVYDTKYHKQYAVSSTSRSVRIEDGERIEVRSLDNNVVYQDFNKLLCESKPNVLPLSPMIALFRQTGSMLFHDL